MTDNLNVEVILLELTNKIEKLWWLIKFWRNASYENPDNEYHKKEYELSMARFDELMLLYYKITGEDYKVTGKYIEDEE